MKLNNHDINQAVEEIRIYFEKSGVSSEDRIRLGLLAEEALLCFQSQFGEEEDFTLLMREVGPPKATVRVRGAVFDPLSETREGGSYFGSVFLQKLLDFDAAQANFEYRNGMNDVVFTAVKQKRQFKIPGGSVTVGVLLGAVAALLSKMLPEAIRSFLLNDLASPLLSALLALILLVTGPVIFISVISGICALDDLSTLSKLGLRVLRRFFVIAALLIVFTVGVCFLFFPGLSADAAGAFRLSDIIAMLLDLIPRDLVSPFVEGKMVQVVILATVVGVAILILGERVPRLKAFVVEANSLVFEVMRIAAKVIPLAVFLSIYKAVVANSLASIVGVWKVIAANYAAFLPFCALMMLWVVIRNKINLREFLGKISPVLFLAFSTASGSLSMTKNFEVCKDGLGIDSKLCDFWIPLSHAMFSPSVVVPLVVAAFYSAEYYGTSISLTQLLIVFILVVQLSIASPKVPGGIMATFTILLNQMGMPLEAVGLLMVANVFCVNAETAFGMLIRDLDLVDLAAHQKQ